jgi:hypothetical protein
MVSLGHRATDILRIVVVAMVGPDPWYARVLAQIFQCFANEFSFRFQSMTETGAVGTCTVKDV